MGQRKIKSKAKKEKQLFHPGKRILCIDLLTLHLLVESMLTVYRFTSDATRKLFTNFAQILTVGKQTSDTMQTL